TTGGEIESSIPLVVLAMLISTILSLLITKVYQITFTGERYSQAFVHTIIMMSVIVSVVMNVISGTAGLHFGLLAVFSLVRFRSAVTDAKDIAYVFVGLCVVMTSVLFRYDLAIILTLFASFIFYLLYKLEYGKAKDPQILKITVPENLNHEDMFKNIFQNLTESVKLRQ